ncbi:PREDICTED: tumor necrosis factor receptor superfamily member 14-like [Cyprinodon variegatus]|uniref:tumor necrosis factor receptor superfamily member 14-like n=1 Tax=Cyprinodon variegatus TaxID=28743 RepID=UPI0007427BE4|nr:PREDICTED: tumor necrosis factor receptor superfamily member 14-like [Cyprinodon variegatus]
MRYRRCENLNHAPLRLSLPWLSKHVTEYRIGNECCPLCPSGSRVETDCTEFRTTSCQLCSAGTYVDEPNGLKRCPPCFTCDSEAGLKVKRECGRYADTVCEPMEGFFCTDPKPGGCGAAQRHRSCKPGQFIRRTGWTSSAFNMTADFIFIVRR